MLVIILVCGQFGAFVFLGEYWGCCAVARRAVMMSGDEEDVCFLVLNQTRCLSKFSGAGESCRGIEF